MRCAGCQRETTWQDNPWRPFCSERCQLVDLGRWVSGEYRIPLFEDPDSPDEGALIEVEADAEDSTKRDEN